MARIIKQSFQINLFFMKFFYLFPTEEFSYLYTIESCFAYLFCFVWVPSLSILYLLFENNLDMDKVIYNAGFLAQMTGFITKFLPLVTHGRRIKSCIMYFESPFFIVGRNNHKEIIDKCVKDCRRNSFIFLTGTIAAVMSWATKPLFWEGRQLPVDIWLPFDANRNLITYCCTYLSIISVAIITSVITAAIDPLIAGLADHARSQVTILKDNLQNLSKYANEDLGNNMEKPLRSYNLYDTIIYNKIKQCARHYDAILKFVAEFETCFSLVTFSQLSSGVFTLCFCCLQLSQADTLGYSVQLIVYIIVLLGEIYFYCYYGSKLFDESSSLTNAIYMSNWYDFDRKSKNALKIFMERSKKPMVITSGKILELSLVTFTTILKRSYSLLAVLKSYT